MRQIGLGVPVLAAALFGAAPVLAECQVGKFAEFPVTMQDMKPLTEAKVNGAEVRFTIDSGAFFSVISPGNARALGLDTQALPARMRGIGGDAAMSVATVKSFTISGQEVPRVQFVVAGSDLGRSGIGVLGQNFLGLRDVEYDLPHGMVRLMESKGCEKSANMAYWAKDKPVSVVQLLPREPRNPHTVGTVQVNGVKIRATFDTGAGGSMLSMAAAARAGITPKSPGVVDGGFIAGFGRKLVRSWIAPVDSFQVGDQEVIHHGRIRFAELNGDTEMLLGMDFLITHRVYVANRLNRLFLTYEGGPVFNLKTEHRDESGATIADAAPATADVPTTADGFSRAGAVKLARNDRTGALADFDKAIEMDAKQPAYLLQRAELTLGMGRRASAAIDIDRALALAPEDVDAHLLRARLILAENGFAAPGMAPDLDAADRAAPLSAIQRLALGQLYIDAGLAARAVAQFDQWIKYHPDDVRRPSALNGRCWARGLADTDLPAALSDCNAAIRAQPGNILFVDSRALVELRMGQFAKAIEDFDTVLAKQARPWALYMRGMAKQRAGDASGKAEMEAALKKAPRLIDRAKAYGLAG